MRFQGPPVIWPGEKGYLNPADGESVCCQNDGQKYICTRKKGHRGDHAGHGVQGEQFDRWPREKAEP